MNEPPPTDPMLPAEPDPPPALDPVVIADDELLGMAVDAVVYADLDARARMLEIARYAEALRASLDAEMWATFMRFDELANGRFAELLLVIARWAFDGGQKHPMESPS